MTGFNVDMDLSGLPRPAEAGRIMTAASDAAMDYLAEHVVDEVAGFVRLYTSAPTGNYARHITYDRTAGARVVHDSDVDYGPWLEGTSQRNKTTRYKGIHAFRQVRAETLVNPRIWDEARAVFDRRVQVLM